uniref:hypothetical protein n=1 Tax=Pararhizobium sp. IMCC3301 TaxID=3067904 RepID=UPI002742996E|nr:hypothetical protein [Pararhizobium sp. IMCC3301]
MLEIIDETLVMSARLLTGRVAEPTADVIDNQSVKTNEAMSRAALMRLSPMLCIVHWQIGRRTQGAVLIPIFTGFVSGLHVACFSFMVGDIPLIAFASMKWNFPCLAYLFADGGYAG